MRHLICWRRRKRGNMIDENDPDVFVYHVGDAEIDASLKRCQRLCHEYNMLFPDETEKRQALIHEIVPDIAGWFEVTQPFHCDHGHNIHIGETFYSNYNLTILDSTTVEIGDNVMIGPNCGIYTAEHPIDAKRRDSGLEFARPVRIGSHVWIGGGVNIMPGVTIGSNVVIGGGSVVVHDIPDNVVAAGNPCRVVRSIEE